MDDVGLLFGLVANYVPCLLMLAGIVLAGCTLCGGCDDMMEDFVFLLLVISIFMSGVLCIMERMK